MKPTALLIAGAVVAVVTTETATAVDFFQVDLRPYIVLSSHLVVANTFNPTELVYEEQQQFITQGGATFSSFSAQVEQKIPSSQVYRGIATAGQLNGLRDRLNIANIRAQRSCEIRSTGGREGAYDITWYSIRGKRNSFKVLLSRVRTALPPCQAPLIQLLADLRAFESEILTNPDTEVLMTPH
jgi:hypothetical protein